MNKIKSVFGRMVLDSRGIPTVEAIVELQKGTGIASSPSGTSTGIYEAIELRDNKPQWQGKGVLQAIENINKVIGPKLKGKDASKQQKIDQLLIELDETKNKSKLGANALIAVSTATAKAQAEAEKKEVFEYIAKIAGNKKPFLPIPCFNLLEGGKHAGNDLDFQEFLLIPEKAENFTEALQIGAETYHILKSIIREKFGKTATNLGEEGGFAPPLSNTEDALKLLNAAAKQAHYAEKTVLGIDCAASSFFKNGRYVFEGKEVENIKLVEVLEKLAEKYNVTYLEDPAAEDDLQGFCSIKKGLPKIQVVGDDLTVTQKNRIERAVKLSAINSVVIKPNQIGTLTEAIESAKYAEEKGLKIIASHRAGETEDSFIADFAVGIGAGKIKAGAPARGESTNKYNRLLRIEEILGKKAGYGK